MKYIKKIKKLLSVGLILILVLSTNVGCSSKNNDDDNKKVVKMIYGISDSYDTSVNYIAGNWITAGVVETLFTIDSDGNIKNFLAENYKQVDDLTWKIKLKENIKFHNGDLMDADAVIFSLDRLINTSQMDYVQSIEKDSDYIVTIKTKQPYRALLSKLSEYKSAIVSPKNDFKNGLIGTGPFKFEKTEPEVKTVVTRFDGYWGGDVKLDKIELIPNEDEMSWVYMLYNQDVDASYIPLPVTEVSNVEKDKNLNAIRSERVEQTVLLMNTEKGMLKNKDVRHALSYAIDREQLVEKACEGIGGMPSYQYLPPNSKWSNNEKILGKYDPQKALELLKKSGIEDTNADGVLEYNGEDFELSLMTYDYNLFKPSVEVIQSQLEKIGIKVNLEVTTWDVTDKKMQNGDYDINLDMAVFYEFANPNSLSDNFESNSFVAKCTRYKNPKIDELLKKANACINENESKQYYYEIQELAINDLAVMPLYFDVKYIGMSKRLENYSMNPNMISKFTKDTDLKQ